MSRTEWLLMGIVAVLTWRYVVVTISAVLIALLTAISVLAELIIYVLTGPIVLWQWLTKSEKHYK